MSKVLLNSLINEENSRTLRLAQRTLVSARYLKTPLPKKCEEMISGLDTKPFKVQQGNKL